MPQPVSTPSAQASTLRNLKVLVVLLVVSNIFVGALSAYLLHAVDQRYSDLVDRSVPALNDLRELMTDTVAAMRSTNPRLLAGPETIRSASLKAMQAALTTEEKFLADFLKTSGLNNETQDRATLMRAGAEFNKAAAEVARLYFKGQTAEAAQMREEKLRPVFDRYFAAMGQAADAVESVSLAANKDYTGRTSSLSTLVLGVASWPVILLFGLLLLTAVFVIAMMIAFRGKDLSDMP